MKTKSWLFLTLLGLSSLLPAQSGGDFEIVRSTLDAGGGLSSGDPYELTGTIAQAEADPNLANGGDFSLRGGFYRDGLIDEELVFQDGFEG